MGCSFKQIRWRIQIQDILGYFITQRKILWVIYRVVVAIYCLTAVTLWMIRASTKYSALVYLTTWTYIMLCLYAILAVIGPLYIKSSQRLNKSDAIVDQLSSSDGTSGGDLHTTGVVLLDKVEMNLNECPDGNDNKHRLLSIFGMICGNERETQTRSFTWGQCIFLVLWNTSASISSVLGITVTIVYYSAICQSVPTCDRYANINVHGLNSLFILIDLMSCRPIGFFQIVFPLVYGTVYGFFTVMFWVTDHSHVIYTILNWNKVWRSLGWTLGFLVVGVFVQIVIYYLNVLLRKCCYRFNGTKSDIQEADILKK